MYTSSGQWYCAILGSGIVQTQQHFITFPDMSPAVHQNMRSDRYSWLFYRVSTLYKKQKKKKRCKTMVWQTSSSIFFLALRWRHLVLKLVTFITTKWEKIALQYCLTTNRYRKILHPSKLHNMMWLWIAQSLFIYLFVHSLARLFFRSFVRSFIYLFIYSFIRPLTRSFVRSFIYLFIPFSKDQLLCSSSSHKFTGVSLLLNRPIKSKSYV